ncbi:MAG TPA: hypothetical protein PK773_08485, partial [Aminivibrio sp.]|nr:hypothetical protein [Aminivibrio sp.]
KSILDGLSAGNPRIKYNILHALQCLDERDKWSEGGTDEVSPPSGDEVQGEMTWEKTADSL